MRPPARPRSVLRETLSSFGRHGGTLLSGAVAYFALLSAAPLLLVALEIAGRTTGADAARSELLVGLARWLGDDGARTVESLLDNVRAEGARASVRVVAVLALVYGSTRLFTNLQRALNHMWDVRTRPSPSMKTRAWRLLRRRVLAFVMVLLCGLCLVSSVVVRTVIAAASAATGASFSTGLHLVDHGLSFVVATLLLTAVFELLPDVRLAWRDAFAGALVTAVLFVPGKILIALYLGHRNVASVFGVAGSLIVVMLWAHYSAQIFFLGAAFTEVRARRQGRPIEPSANAVRVDVVEEI